MILSSVGINNNVLSQLIGGNPQTSNRRAVGKVVNNLSGQLNILGGENKVKYFLVEQ